jgi:hypothetical protein
MSVVIGEPEASGIGFGWKMKVRLCYLRS